MRIKYSMPAWSGRDCISDEGPPTIKGEGEIAGAIYDSDRRETCFIVWQADEKEFVRVPISAAKKA